MINEQININMVTCSHELFRAAKPHDTVIKTALASIDKHSTLAHLKLKEVIKREVGINLSFTMLVALKVSQAGKTKQSCPEFTICCLHQNRKGFTTLHSSSDLRPLQLQPGEIRGDGRSLPSPSLQKDKAAGLILPKSSGHECGIL